MIKLAIYLPVVATGLLFLTQAIGYEAKGDCVNQQRPQYAYSWPIEKGCKHKPRGGTSKGQDVSLASSPSRHWVALQEAGLSKFEQDRRAILAMQGGYKVNFDFIETLGFSEKFERDQPYQSWGTEYVYVVEDTSRFISLQHVMVMFFKTQEGGVSEPMVMKHWRQDWTYQDTSLLEYRHNETWENTALSAAQAKGRWSQAVFQVDDSPRYESIGDWEHNASFSSWKSEKTRRPLPRREYSVRSDYGVLEGFNTHVVNRHGWVQVEENWKLVTDASGEPSQTAPYLAKEQGLARYQPVIDFDFSEGDTFMKLTAQFWRDVRTTWGEKIAAQKTLSLHKKVDNQPLFMSLFSYANSIAEQGEYDQVEGRKFASAEISKYIQ